MLYNKHDYVFIWAILRSRIFNLINCYVHPILIIFSTLNIRILNFVCDRKLLKTCPIKMYITRRYPQMLLFDKFTHTVLVNFDCSH